MRRLLLERLAMMPLIALGVITVLFVTFKSVPGDEAAMAAGAMANQAEIEVMRHRLGLDQPLLTQYAGHILGLLQGDFGYSSTFRGNALWPVLERVPATLALMGSAIATTILVGVPVGVWAGSRQGGLADHLLSGAVVTLLAVPNFWLGQLLITLFSVQLRWLPSFGFGTPLALVIPTLALAARLIALAARLTRGLVIEELRKDYVRTAYAKGLARRRVLLRHVLRNVAIPIITVIGLQAGYLLGGSIVIERLCAWPGVGDLMLTGVSVRDYPLIQGITLFFVFDFLLINLLVEILYRFANPRLRYG